MPEINDWVEKPVDDWQEVPIVGQQAVPKLKTSSGAVLPTTEGTNLGLANDLGKSLWETPLTLASGAVAFPIAKVGGAAMAAWQSMKGNKEWGKEAQDFENFLSQYYTYQPQSETGKATANIAGGVMSAPTYLTDKASEYLDEKGLSNEAYLLKTAGQYGTIAAAPTAARGAGKVAGKVVEKVATTDLPERIYGSAVKTPLSKKWTKQLPGEEISQRTRVVQEGIAERVPPSEYGIQKAKRLELDARTEVDNTLKDAVIRGDKTIPVDTLLDAGLKGAYEIAAKSSDPAGAMALIEDFRAKFKEGHGEEINVFKANAVKRQLYDEVKWQTDKPTGLTAQIGEVNRKGVAHQIMSELEARYPELDALNYKDGARIGLVEALEKSVSRWGNRDLLGLGAKVLGVKNIPMMVFEATLGHPQIKARLAFALDKARNMAKGMVSEASVSPQWPQGGLDRTFSDYADNNQWGNPTLSNIPDKSGGMSWNLSTGALPRGASIYNQAMEAEAMRRGIQRGTGQPMRGPLTLSELRGEIGLPQETTEGISLLRRGSGTTPKELLSSPEKIIVRGKNWAEMDSKKKKK